MKIKWFLLFFTVTYSFVAAGQNKTDSLLTLLKRAGEDTNKLNILQLLTENISNGDSVNLFNEQMGKLAKTLQDNHDHVIQKTAKKYQALYFNNIGSINYNAGILDQARDNYLKSLEINIKTNDKKETAQLLNNLGFVYLDQGDYPKAFEYFQNSLQINEAIKNGIEIAESLNNIGMVYQHQGKIDEALNYFQRSIKKREEIDDKPGFATSLNNIGTIYYGKGDFLKALEYYSKSMAVYEEIPDNSGFKESIASTLNNFGVVYRELGDVPKALDYYQKSIKFREDIGDKSGIANSLNNMGRLYYDQHDTTKILEYAFKSLKIFEQINDKSGTANTFNILGFVYQGKGDLTKAKFYYQKSLDLREEIGDKNGIAASLNNFARIYELSGDKKRALAYCERSLKIREETGDKRGMSSTLFHIGKIYEEQNDLAKAKSYGFRSYLLSLETGSTELIVSASGLLKLVYKKQGNFKEAMSMYELEVKMRDSVQNVANRKLSVKSQFQYEYQKKEDVMKAEHDKKEALANSEIKRQKLIRNSTFGGAGIAGIFTFLLIISYNRRRKTSFEKQVSEVEMKALRSQMNPHFIFNSLNSVKKYIIENAKSDAAEYLSKFSTLMRMILENSRKQEVTLEKDLSALQLYMELESLRFQNRFQFAIEVDPEIDREDTLIAPLLLQPFVENSIIHGISSKENGMIKVKVSKVDNMIKCTVEDNGIGRDQSVQVETGEKKKRESLGMKITQERLSIINRLKKVKTAITIFDLKDAENKPEGLRIELILPFETAF